ncbi:hypothetical protein KIN20_011871 [Parelaphostrongylus tenuis]|nr:hypothetical protein KIN20_011871 [Parelaphostrongylus tenuis]
MQTAVDSCKKAFDSWKSVSPLTRQQAFFRLQSLIKRDMKKIADNITKEQGKTLPDAEGDVSRGLQEAGVPDGCVNVIHGQHEAVTILTFTQSHSLELIKLVNISTNVELVMENGCNRIWELRIMEWSCLTVTKSRHSISRHGESELHHCRHYGDGNLPQNG